MIHPCDVEISPRAVRIRKGPSQYPEGDYVAPPDVGTDKPGGGGRRPPPPALLKAGPLRQEVEEVLRGVLADEPDVDFPSDVLPVPRAAGDRHIQATGRFREDAGAVERDLARAK